MKKYYDIDAVNTSSSKQELFSKSIGFLVFFNVSMIIRRIIKHIHYFIAFAFG